MREFKSWFQMYNSSIGLGPYERGRRVGVNLLTSILFTHAPLIGSLSLIRNSIWKF